MEHHKAGRLEQAADGYRAILDQTPRHTDACHLLALIALELGYSRDAVELTRIAVEEAPTVVAFWTSHGDALAATSRDEEAIAAYGRARELDPGHLAATFNLGLLLHRINRHEDAVQCFRLALEIEPGHATATHLMAALTDGAADSSPAEYVEALFDSYAGEFDDHLKTKLGYDVPRDLCNMLAPPAKSEWLVVDLGCGTGLVGELLRASAARLIGCDLSANMLQRAAAKKLYDQLRQEDVLATLERFAEEVDVIVAADLLIYVGDPKPMLSACHRALRPGGRLAVSIEDAEVPLTLRSSGRFAHAPAALEAAAADAGLEVLRRQSTAIRTEEHRPIEGSLYLLARPAS